MRDSKTTTETTMLKTDTYTAAKTTRDDAYRDLGLALRDLDCERRRGGAYGEIAIAAGGTGWQQIRADSSASRLAQAERRAKEAGERYDIAAVAAHVALTYDGCHDDMVRDGRPSASGKTLTPAVETASRSRAEVLGLDWDALHAGWVARRPERDAAYDATVQRTYALSGRLGRDAQKAAQRKDNSWRGAGHAAP